MIICLLNPIDGTKVCLQIPDPIRTWPGFDPGPPERSQWVESSVINPVVACDIAVAATIENPAMSISDNKFSHSIASSLKTYINGIELPKGVSVEVGNLSAVER